MKMKTTIIAFICMALGLILGYLFFHQHATKEVSATASEAAVLQNIMTRTSVRAYQDRPIEDEKVEKMLQAAMAAPTAANKQPWKFIIIKDKNTLKTIADHFHTMTMAAHAPMAIVVCGDMSLTLDRDGRDYWIEDTSAATENLLLAAHSMGLGAVWCGIYPQMERVKYLSELLKLPEYIVPLNVIPMGYPAEDPAPKDKWKPESVHYESWTGEIVNAWNKE
jgi:nitroreductase